MIRIAVVEDDPLCQAQLTEHIRFDVIIAVNKEKILTKGCFDAGVACGGKAAIFLVDDPDAGIFLDPGITQSRAVVRASVIYKDKFKIRKGLRTDTADTLIKVFFHAIDGNDHTDGGGRHMFHQPLIFPIVFRRAAPTAGCPKMI